MSFQFPNSLVRQNCHKVIQKCLALQELYLLFANQAGRKYQYPPIKCKVINFSTCMDIKS